VFFDVNPVPAPVITGDADVCKGQQVTYTTEPGMDDYGWVVTGGTVTAGGLVDDDFVTVLWSTAGSGTVSVNYTDPDGGCTAASATLVNIIINDLPVVSDVTLTASYGQNALDNPWGVGGSFTSFFDICVDATLPSGWFYHLDIDDLTSSQTLKLNYLNPFTLDQTSLPANWLSYWAARGVDGTSTNPLDWEYWMWPIINGNAPIFYIWYTGTDYQLIDGLVYQSTNTMVPLRISGDYPQWQYKYSGSVRSDWDCESFFDVFMEINPIPDLDITDPAPVCEPTTVDLTAGAVTAGSTLYGATLSYWLDGNATNPLLTPAAVSTGGTYYIKATTPKGCYDTDPVLVTINPTPVLVITNPAAVCQPLTVDLTNPAIISGSTLHGASLSYFKDVSGSPVAISVQDAGVIAVDGIYYIRAATSAGCIDEKPVTVTINPTPVLVITDPAPVCQPGTVDLMNPGIITGSTIPPGTSFSFYKYVNGTPVLLSILEFSSISVSGTYYIKAETSAGCYDMKPVNVTINPTPILVITNPAAVCQPLTVDLTNPAIISGSTLHGASLSYFKDVSGSPVAISVQDAGAIAVGGIYYIRAATAVGCFDMQQVTVTINPKPILVINDPAPVCDPGYVDLTAAAVTAGSTLYGATLTYWEDAGATTQLTNNPPPTMVFQSGTYYIKATTTEGCYDIKPVTVTIHQRPAPSITGPDNVCAGSVGIVYSTDPGMSNYQWSIFGGVITAGATTSTITVTWGPDGGGDLNVNYTDPLTGCDPLNPAMLPITINALPVVSLASLTAVVGTPGNTTPWPVGGSFNNFNICVDPLIANPAYYFLDINVLTSTIPLQTGSLNGFTVNQSSLPGNWLTYWAAKGVTAAATPGTWQYNMWPIINGNAPIFYIHYDGIDYKLVDGLLYQAGQGMHPLQIPGDYPEWNYRYTGRVLSQEGCYSSFFDVFMEINTVPVPTINVPGVGCIGYWIGYTTEPGMSNYDWDVSANGTVQQGGGTTDDFVVVTWNSGTTGTISVNYVDPDGNCSAAAPAVATIQLTALPVVTGMTITASVGATPGVTPWPVGGSFNSFSMCVDPLVTSPNYYYFDIDNLTSTLPLMNGMNPFMVDQNNLPPNWFAYWDGKGVNASATPGTWEAAMWNAINGYAPYFLILYDFTNDYQLIDAAQYQLDQTLVPWRIEGDFPEWDYKFTGIVYSTDGCMSSFFDVFFEINTVPVPTITGPDQVCEGVYNRVYTTEASMNNYQWSVTNGTIVAGGTSTDNTVTIDWGMGAGGSVSVNYVDHDGSCTAALPTVKNVSFIAQPLANAGPDDISCNSATYTLAAVATVGTGTWSQFSGEGVASFFDIHDPATTVTVDVAGVYTFMWLEDNNFCASADFVEITFLKGTKASTTTLGPIADKYAITGSPVMTEFVINHPNPDITANASIQYDGLIQFSSALPAGAKIIELKRVAPITTTYLPIADGDLGGKTHVLFSEILGNAPGLLKNHTLNQYKYVATIEGINTAGAVDVTFSMVTYLGTFDIAGCFATLASETYTVTYADALVTAPAAPLQSCTTDEIDFSVTITYPQISGIDLNGEIKADARLTLNSALTTGATLMWGYNAPATNPSAVSIVGETEILLSEIVGSTAPLAGHDGLTDVWNLKLVLSNQAAGVYNVGIQSMITLTVVEPAMIRQDPPNPSLGTVAPLPGEYVTKTYYHASDNFTLVVAPCEVSGYFRYYNTALTPMNNLTVALYDGATQVATTTTDATGYYAFTGIPSGTYEVITTVPAAVSSYGSVNATDAGQANAWQVGPIYNIEKIRYLAGDVFRQTPFSSITSFDANRIIEYFLNLGGWTGSTYTWPAPTGVWSFWNAGEAIAVNEWTDAFNPRLTVGASTPTTNNNFYCLASGDFDRNFTPASKAGNGQLLLNPGNPVLVQPGMEVALEVKVVNPVDAGAVSIILNYPPDKMEVTGVFLGSNLNNPVRYRAVNGKLLIAWTEPTPFSAGANSPLLTITVRALSALSQGEQASFILEANPLNELADGTFQVIPGVELVMDFLEGTTTGMGEGFTAEQLKLSAYPNPFSDVTALTYHLPAEARVSLEVYDILGQIVARTEPAVQPAGQHQLMLDAAGWKPGVYLAALRVQRGHSTMTKTIRIVNNR
jgi:hypothetical protein